MSQVTAELIESTLRAALGDIAALDVVNESHLHAGHAGAAEGSHWRVRIACQRMTGLTPVARHRLVYDALQSVIPQGIQALAIEAKGV